MVWSPEREEALLEPQLFQGVAGGLGDVSVHFLGRDSLSDVGDLDRLEVLGQPVPANVEGEGA